MRWLLINPIKSVGWGGMEGWMLRLARQLIVNGEECTLVGRAESPWPARCAEAGITFEPLRFGGDLSVWAWCSLARIVRRRRPDVIIAKGFRQARWARLTSRTAAIAVKLPSAVELGSSFVDRWTAGAVVDRLLTDCRATRDELLRFPWLRPARVVVAYNGVAPPSNWPNESLRRRMRTELLAGRSDGGSIAMVVGRLTSAKRVDDALVAFAAATHGITAHLVVVGDGPARSQLEALSRSLGLHDRVQWLGWRDDAARLVWGADVLIHASEREGLSNVILEAMAAGLPVVATRVGGAAEVVEDGVTGRIVQCGDRISLTAAIRDLLCDLSLASRFGAAAAARVRERFTVDAMVQTIRRALSEIVQIRRRLVQTPQRVDRMRWLEAEPGAADPVMRGELGPHWTPIKITSRVTVHRRECTGDPDLYVKRFCSVRWRDRLSSSFRRPRAWANYRVAQRLALRGFTTVPHLAAAWMRKPAGGVESVLLTAAVAGAIPLDAWVRTVESDPRARARGAVAAGRWLASMHENWVIPHDLKASNLLVRPDQPDELILLDLDNCSVFRPPRVRDIVRNFAQFRRSFERELDVWEWRRFCVAYARARRWSKQRLCHLLERVEARARRRGMRSCAPSRLTTNGNS